MFMRTIDLSQCTRTALEDKRAFFGQLPYQVGFVNVEVTFFVEAWEGLCYNGVFAGGVHDG